MSNVQLNADRCPTCGELFCGSCVDAAQSDADMNKHIKQKQKEKEVREAIKTLVDNLNLMGNENLVGNAIAKELAHTHRTLQQEFMKTVVGSVLNFFVWQKERNLFDARNEATVNLAEEMKEKIDNTYLPFI